MNIIDRFKLSDNKKHIVHEINRLIDIRANGIYVLFDDGDNRNYLNPVYTKNLAVQMNVRLGGIEEMSPSHILEIMENEECEYFIWISRGVCQTDEKEFAWIYAHELQHLKQDLLFPHISTLSCFLSITYPRVDPTKNVIDVPAELDAELNAAEVFKTIFGEEERDKYVTERMVTMRCKEHVDRLIDAYNLTPINIEAETIRILCEQKHKFAYELSECNKTMRKFNIDLDKLCAKHLTTA